MTTASIATSDASDSAEVEQLPEGFETANVTFRTGSGEKKTSIQIIDLRSKPPLQYVHNSMRLISIKCALLVLGIPFFAVATMFIYFARTITLVIGTFSRTIIALCHARSWSGVERICTDWLENTTEIILQSALDTLKVPYLALKMQWCCLYGIFYPLEGRTMAAEAEKGMKRVDRTKDLRCSKNLVSDLFRFFTDKDSQTCLYWAFCFQPIGPAVVQGNGTKRTNILRIETLRPRNKIVVS